MTAAVEARGLTKCYRIYRHPHDRLLEWLGWQRRQYSAEVYALKDVDFSVPPGSTLGLIGQNGAGKSTLLQLVAGTLRPSSGRLSVNGRLSAILDLGAGFHPEFTGRENVFMAGAILGFSAKEMEERLEAIAAFAEIGEFLDRPVRTYSSGMFVRLAFSVATSVEPDILVIDEVLAVGDQYFQKKCIDRIDGFRKGGKTILFCSHNMYQVRSICDQVLWLRDGTTAALGDTITVVEAYESYLRERAAEQQELMPTSAPVAPGLHPRIAGVRLNGQDAGPLPEIQTGQTFTVTVSWEIPIPPTTVHVGIRILRNDGLHCFATATHVDGVKLPTVSGEVTFRIPSLPFLGGEYDLHVFLLDETGLHLYDQRRGGARFVVHHNLPAMGLVYLPHEWEVGPGLAAD